MFTTYAISGNSINLETATQQAVNLNERINDSTKAAINAATAKAREFLNYTADDLLNYRLRSVAPVAFVVESLLVISVTVVIEFDGR